MEKINFVAQIWKTGNSAVITIPKYLIENGIVKEGQKYSITIKEVENGANNS